MLKTFARKILTKELAKMHDDIEEHKAKYAGLSLKFDMATYQIANDKTKVSKLIEQYDKLLEAIGRTDALGNMTMHQKVKWLKLGQEIETLRKDFE